jgi:hypothetical protein
MGVTPPAPKAGASASFATPAYISGQQSILTVYIGFWQNKTQPFKAVFKNDFIVGNW